MAHIWGPELAALYRQLPRKPEALTGYQLGCQLSEPLSRRQRAIYVKGWSPSPPAR